MKDLVGSGGECVGDSTLQVFLSVSPDSESSSSRAAVAVDILGASTTSAGSALALLGGASILDVHTLVLLMNSPCASLLDHKRVNYMMYIVSPFFAIGYEAVVFGNIGIVALVTALQTVVAWLFKSSRRITWLSACAAVYFPSLALKVAELAYVGIAIAAFSLLREHQTIVGIASGVIGLLYVFGVPASVVATIHFKVNARMVQYTQFLSRPFLQRLMLPYGFWTPEAMERAYGRHIGSFLPGFRMYLSAYPMVVAGIVAIFTHLLPDAVSCYIRFVMAAVIFFLAALLLIAIRPHRIHLATGLAAALFLLLGILAIVMAMAYQSPSAILETTKLIVCGIIVLLIVCRVLFDGITTFLEWRRWRHFREQNYDAMNDDGVVGSANDRTAFDYNIDDLEGSNNNLSPSEKKKSTSITGRMRRSITNKDTHNDKNQPPFTDTAVIPMVELVGDDEEHQFSTLSAPPSSSSDDDNTNDEDDFSSTSGGSEMSAKSKSSAKSESVDISSSHTTTSVSKDNKTGSGKPSLNTSPSSTLSADSSHTSDFSDFSDDVL